METTINMHRPEAKYLRVQERHFNYTLGGIEQYHNEISILTENGYTITEHGVLDRDGNPLGIVALYREGNAVKVYEL